MESSRCRMSCQKFSQENLTLARKKFDEGRVLMNNFFSKAGGWFLFENHWQFAQLKDIKIDSFHGSIAFIVRSTLALVSIQAMFLGRTSLAFCLKDSMWDCWQQRHFRWLDLRTSTLPRSLWTTRPPKNIPDEIWDLMNVDFFRRRKRTSTGSVEDNGGMWRRRPGTRNRRRDSETPRWVSVTRGFKEKILRSSFWKFYYFFLWSEKPCGVFYVLKVDMLSKRSLSAEVSEFSANFSENLCGASVLLGIRGNKTARFYAKSIFGDIAEGLSWDLRGDRPGKEMNRPTDVLIRASPLVLCCSDDMLFTIICYLLYPWIPDNYSSSRET